MRRLRVCCLPIVRALVLSGSNFESASTSDHSGQSGGTTEVPEATEDSAWGGVLRGAFELETTPQDDGALARFLSALGVYLERTQAPFPQWFWIEFLPNAFRFFYKMSASLLALAAVSFVVFSVEQIGDLLRARPLDSLFWGGVLVFLPALEWCFVWWRMRRSSADSLHWIQLGLLPFYSYRNQAWILDRGLDRALHLESSGAWSNWMRRLISIQGLKIGCFIIFVLFGGLLVATEGLVLGLLASVVVAAHFVDFWDFVDHRPIKLYVLLLTISVLLAIDRPQLRFLIPLSGMFLVCVFAWMAIKSASTRRFWGAGVLFAGLLTLFSSYVLIDLRRGALQGSRGVVSRVSPSDWPKKKKGPIVVVAASGGGSRAAMYTALTLQALHRLKLEGSETLGCRIEAISSVSGGSLASAMYLAARMVPGQDPCRGATIPKDWVVKAVDQDFLRTTIVGALNPGTSRGEAIMAAWEERLKGATLSDLSARWKDHERWLPLPMFNSATIQSHDVVLSALSHQAFQNYELQSFARTRNPYRAFDDEEPTWVYYRDGLYGFDELLPNFDPRLSEAVLASANFPFGFPLLEVKTEAQLHLSPDKVRRSDRPKSVFLTDGGVLSNSGLWSLSKLLFHRARALQKRGVILVVVEASKMPEYSSSSSGLFRLIKDKNPTGQYLHRQLFDHLHETFEGRIAIVQIDLPPKAKDNIMTTWTLPQDQIRLLKETHHVRFKRLTKTLRSAYQSLNKSCERGEMSCGKIKKVYHERPPLN